MADTHAKYLEDEKTGKVHLVHADALKDTKYVEPKGKKPNGEEWNTDDNEAQRDATAALQKTTDEAAAKKADEKAKKEATARDTAQKASEQAAKDNPPSPDFTVKVVE